MQSGRDLKKIWAKLAGDSTEFHNINIAVNSICLITFGLLSVMLIADIFLGLYSAATLISLLLIINTILFYYARYKKKYDVVILIYTVISYFALGFNYLYNAGINGPTVLGFFLTFLLLAAIVHRKYHLMIAIVHISLMMILYGLEYANPHLIPKVYGSEMVRIADWSIAYAISLAFTYFIVIFMRDNYKRERILAQHRAIELSQQNEKLKTLMAEKDKLFSLISHDMASPLALIQGYLELISEAPIEQEAELKVDLLNLTKRTSDMLMNMLTWSKSQMEGVKMNLKLFNVNELIKEKLPLYKSIAASKDIEIDSSKCEDVYITSDEEMTNAVIRNLISNAIKFTPSFGVITLSIEKKDSFCYIHIADTGIGMSDMKQKELFKLGSNATFGTHNEAGVGLGLVLCKEFVELQNGHISFRSVENKGSVFSIGLPLS